MGSRMKEDEKNEKIIRGLLKQPSNRKCINCNLLGPQYVCTTFSIFVCTTCSGIHREFTHRVKSISMAKFTPQEIAALQAGGNERAREIYFKEWEPQRKSAPDSSNVDRLRDFIKQVYVHRRYAGEKSVDRPPRVELSDKEDPSDSRRSDGYRSASRSPPYDDTRASPGYDVRRSPGYDQFNQRHSDYGRSPIRSGVVNDWRREDRFANGRKSEDRLSSDGESRSNPRSPDNRKDSSMPSPPVVRPVRDILGDNVTPPRISEPPVINGAKTADGPTFTKTASSSSLASNNSNPAEPIKETSLIDFDAEPEPSLTTATTQAQPSTGSAPSDNWACFNNVPENEGSQSFLVSNSSEPSLTQLSMPAANSNVAPTPLGDLFSFSNGSDAFASTGNGITAAFPGAPATNSTVVTLSSVPSGATGAPTVSAVNGGAGQWSAMQPGQQPFLHGAATQPASQPLPSSFSAPNNHGLTGNPSSQGSQVANHAAQTEEVKSSGRRELPVDLFTATYTTSPYQAPGWQTGGLVPGMGYHMHFNPAMAMPTFPQPNKSANPFDVNSESSVQSAAFPSMSSLHSALPNTAAPVGLPAAPNLGNAMPSWMPSQSSYLSSAPQPAQSFGATMPGACMGELPSNVVSPSLRSDGFGDFSNGGIDMSSLNPAAATAAPNPSLGGNPFG